MTASTTNSVGLTILRVTLGLVFFMHGWQKYVQFTISGTQASFTKMGVPAAELMAPAVATLEIVGGAALIVGLLARPFALLLSALSLGILVTVHFKAGFFAAQGGYEFVLILTAATAALALLGPGPLSVDRFLATKNERLRILA